MLSRISTVGLLVLLIAGCSPAASTTPGPTSTVTPSATATVMPTSTRTPSPVPTAFVTPPPPGQPALVPILMYHHLGDLASDASELDRTWTVAPKNLVAQLDWLAAHGYRTVTFPQLAAYLRRSQPLPSKPILITFDDGWQDAYTVGFPALVQHKLVGTFFVYTNAIGRGQSMSWSQLQEMTAAGMDIGAHTLTHPHLRTLEPDAARKEIVDSKTTIEKRLNKRVTTFDYPFGEYDSGTIDLVKQAGFESAVTIAPGFKHRLDDLYTLHRVRVTYDTSLESFIKLLP